jgi:phosphoglycerate dehydrogenase-like enzyme
MELSPPPLVVAFELSERRKSIVADGLAGATAIIYLAELDGAARAEALRNAGALLTHNTAKDLRPGEAALLHSARLIQFTIAGVDFIPLNELPEGVPVATNGGGYAESMDEHALAMTLAAAKRLIVSTKTSSVVNSISLRATAGSRAASANLRLRRHWRRDRPIGVQHRHAGACHQPTWLDG